jgi:acyl-CoA synthetase (NDP forming)
MGAAGQALRPGPVAFLSQSGAIASSLLSRALEDGLGCAAWVSTGNEASVGIEAFLEDLVDDDEVGAFALFVEGLRRPEQFRRAAQAALERGKPVVVFKAGLSEAGGRAIASHTGNLAGGARQYDAFFRRLGVVQATAVEDLMTTAHVLATGPPAKGNRVAVVTMSGGAAAVVADLCSEHGLQLPALSAALRDEIRALVPDFAGIGNPLDVTMVGVDTPTLVADAVDAVIRSAEYDIVLVQLTTNADPAAQTIANALIELRERAPVPILIGRLGARSIAPDAAARYAEASVAVAASPGQLVRHAAAVAGVHGTTSSRG